VQAAAWYQGSLRRRTSHVTGTPVRVRARCRYPYTRSLHPRAIVSGLLLTSDARPTRQTQRAIRARGQWQRPRLRGRSSIGGAKTAGVPRSYPRTGSNPRYWMDGIALVVRTSEGDERGRRPTLDQGVPGSNPGAPANPLCAENPTGPRRPALPPPPTAPSTSDVERTIAARRRVPSFRAQEPTGRHDLVIVSRRATMPLGGQHSQIGLGAPGDGAPGRPQSRRGTTTWRSCVNQQR
jgi:hypothetical protein